MRKRFELLLCRACAQTNQAVGEVSSREQAEQPRAQDSVTVSVCPYAADALVLLEHRGLVPLAQQLTRGNETGRTCSQHSLLPSQTTCWRTCAACEDLLLCLRALAQAAA